MKQYQTPYHYKEYRRELLYGSFIAQTTHQKTTRLFTHDNKWAGKNRWKIILILFSHITDARIADKTVSGQYTQYHNTQCHNTQFQNTQCAKIPNAKIPNAKLPNAIIPSEQYPASEIKGCYFHLCQSFNRKLCELGLKKVYENNPELALTLRMIPALSFVPEPMVSASFDLVIEEIQDVCEIAKLDTEYLQMIIRTFLEKISLDAANQKFNIIKALSGKENKSRKKYRVLNENVKNIAKNFKTDDVVPYLRSLAYYTHSWAFIIVIRAFGGVIE